MTKTIIDSAYLSYHLAALPDRETYLRSTSECLFAAINGDAVGLNDIDLKLGAVQVWYDPPEAEISGQAIAKVMDKHPLIRSYVTRRNDDSPHKISDFLSGRQWRSHIVYNELFVPMGVRHQMAIPTSITSDSAHGWAINRSGQDFTEKALTVARRLQPMLTILDLVYGDQPKPEADARIPQEAQGKSHLTDRELMLLRYLADGLSAQQIANVCRISVRTVRKHLENAYAKLRCHDRMTAVNTARSLGLV